MDDSIRKEELMSLAEKIAAEGRATREQIKKNFLETSVMAHFLAGTLDQVENLDELYAQVGENQKRFNEGFVVIDELAKQAGLTQEEKMEVLSIIGDEMKEEEDLEKALHLSEIRDAYQGLDYSAMMETAKEQLLDDNFVENVQKNLTKFKEEKAKVVDDMNKSTSIASLTPDAELTATMAQPGLVEQLGVNDDKEGLDQINKMADTTKDFIRQQQNIRDMAKENYEQMAAQMQDMAKEIAQLKDQNEKLQKATELLAPYMARQQAIHEFAQDIKSIPNHIRSMGDAVKEAASKTFEHAKNIVKEAGTAVKDAAKTAGTAVKDAAKTAGTAVKEAGVTAKDAVVSSANKAAEKVANKIQAGKDYDWLKYVGINKLSRERRHATTAYQEYCVVNTLRQAEIRLANNMAKIRYEQEAIKNNMVEKTRVVFGPFTRKVKECDTAALEAWKKENDFNKWKSTDKEFQGKLDRIENKYHDDIKRSLDAVNHANARIDAITAEAHERMERSGIDKIYVFYLNTGAPLPKPFTEVLDAVDAVDAGKRYDADKNKAFETTERENKITGRTEQIIAQRKDDDVEH